MPNLQYRILGEQRTSTATQKSKVAETRLIASVLQIHCLFLPHPPHLPDPQSPVPSPQSLTYPRTITQSESTRADSLDSSNLETAPQQS